MIEARDIRKTFFAGTANEVRALRGVDLDIPDGCFVAVIGTNGSGKSTLLNALAGAFATDTGVIKIDGRNVTAWPEHRRARLIGRVFQNPFAGTAAGMTVAENLAIAMRRGLPRGLGMALPRQARQEMREQVRTLKMGLEERLDNPIGTLSGGQRQALTLLMATWRKPRLLLLDEHTAALDPKSAAQVAELTSAIVRREKLTTLMVTHSMQQAAEMPDIIVMMHAGRIVRLVKGAARDRVRVPDLLAAFDQVRRRELLDEAVAAILKAQYR